MIFSKYFKNIFVLTGRIGKKSQKNMKIRRKRDRKRKWKRKEREEEK